MKTPEDEAFDDIARKQGAWGGGFPAKRAMAADKLQEPVREVLKLALEALEEYADHEGKTRAADEAITAIKEALAQPAQEQRPWVELTDEEMKDIRASFSGQFLETWEFAYKVQVATQAKLKDRNT